MRKYRRILAIVLALLGVLSICLLPRLSAGRQLTARMEELLDAVEKADRRALEGLLAPGFRDAWGMDRARAVDMAVRLAQQFWTLEVRVVSGTRQITGLRGEVATVVALEGRGTAAAEATQRRVARLRQPFVWHWEREAWKPWSWRLSGLEQAEIGRDELPDAW